MIAEAKTMNDEDLYHHLTETRPEGKVYLNDKE